MTVGGGTNNKGSRRSLDLSSKPDTATLSLCPSCSVKGAVQVLTLWVWVVSVVVGFKGWLTGLRGSEFIMLLLMGIPEDDFLKSWIWR